MSDYIGELHRRVEEANARERAKATADQEARERAITEAGNYIKDLDPVASVPAATEEHEA